MRFGFGGLGRCGAGDGDRGAGPGRALFVIGLALGAQLFAQGALLDLFDLTGNEVAQTERAVADADQAIDRQIYGRHGTADLAVAALADAHGQPGVGALDAVEDDRHGLELLAVDGDSAAQRLQIGIGRVAVDADAVLAQPAGRGQLKAAFQLAVIGQKQQPLGIEVEPAHRHHAGQVGRQVVEHRLAALFVGVRGDEALGLVIEPQAGGFGFGQRLARHRDLVGGFHIQRGRGDDLAVDRHFADFDHPLGLAPRRDTGARQDLGNTLALMGLCGGFFGGFRGWLGFLGHSGHPRARGGQPRGLSAPGPLRIFEDR